MTDEMDYYTLAFKYYNRSTSKLYLYADKYLISFIKSFFVEYTKKRINYNPSPPPPGVHKTVAIYLVKTCISYMQNVSVVV